MTINIANIRKIAPNASATSTASVTRSKTDTIVDARVKVVKKLQRNIAFVENGMKVAKGESLDLVFKLCGDNTYKVGAKYGNRWLQNLLGKDEHYADGIELEQLVDVLKLFISEVENGHADESIKVVQLNNRAGHSKAA